MNEQIRDALATRTVAVRLPDGDTQYWLTDQVFVEGDTLRRNGHAWVVADVLDHKRSGGYLTVKLREAAA